MFVNPRPDRFGSRYVDREPTRATAALRLLARHEPATRLKDPASHSKRAEQTRKDSACRLAFAEFADRGDSTIAHWRTPRIQARPPSALSGDKHFPCRLPWADTIAQSLSLKNPTRHREIHVQNGFQGKVRLSTECPPQKIHVWRGGARQKIPDKNFPYLPANLIFNHEKNIVDAIIVIWQITPRSLWFM